MQINKLLLMCYVMLSATFAWSQEPSLEQLLGDHFGQRQVEQMLEDRPEMKDGLPPEHPLVEWVTKAYGGSQINQRVYWYADLEDVGFDAHHGTPSPGCLPFIWVTDRQDVSSVDKWAAVVFEFHNMKNSAEFLRLWHSAWAGQLSGEQYATSCVGLEFQALKATHKLLQQYPIAHTTAESDPWYTGVMNPEAVAALTVRQLTGTPQELAPRNYAYFLESFQEAVPAFAPQR